MDCCSFAPSDESIESTLNELLRHEQSHDCVEADQWVDDKQEALFLVRLGGEDGEPEVEGRKLESKEKQRILELTNAGGRVGDHIRRDQVSKHLLYSRLAI